MKGIPNTERQRLGALLDHETQETVMAMIPQFSETEIGAPVPAPAEVPEELGLLVFNMERGVHLEELGDFLQDCPASGPWMWCWPMSWMMAASAPAAGTPLGIWRSGSAGTTPTAWSSSSW